MSCLDTDDGNKGRSDKRTDYTSLPETERTVHVWVKAYEIPGTDSDDAAEGNDRKKPCRDVENH